ncbi:hypothetical protein [Streptomyces sp. MMG1533]|uniref:hypothetical protein n=1 Tax=Streptomyces sp. MMG1533 TaxID=1415546 RepID=UPI00131C70C8|nr:hypothetical protein [Streptomyces sp. MMG1533]
MLQARLQRNQLDVPVVVADREAGSVLQSATWHPALETALRRRFRLDVLLVCNYDTMSPTRNGHCQRRLAKARRRGQRPRRDIAPARAGHT